MDTKKVSIAQVFNLVLFWLAMLSFVGYAIYAIIMFARGEFESFKLLKSLGVIPVMLVPFLFRIIFKRKLPVTITISYYLFLIVSVLLGALLKVYSSDSFWNKIVHGLSGVIFSMFALIILRGTIYKNGAAAGKTFVFFFVLCFGIAVGTVWEFWEFFIDGVCGSNLQQWADSAGTALVGRSALADTMFDLISDTIGALITATTSAIWLKFNPLYLDAFKLDRTKIDGEPEKN